MTPRAGQGWESGPVTFPGCDYYEPDVQGSSSYESLPLPDGDELAEVKRREAERRARPFGFARALDPAATVQA